MLDAVDGVNSLRGGMKLPGSDTLDQLRALLQSTSSTMLGRMEANASGEQLGLSAGMTSLLIVPGLPGPGIVCVPDIDMSLVGG